MDDIIIATPDETPKSLAELAVQIKAEHGCVEAAVRDGIAHARRAGALLLEAKAKVPHGEWLAWLQAYCEVTPRTAQRYIRVAEHWDEIVAKRVPALDSAQALCKALGVPCTVFDRCEYAAVESRGRGRPKKAASEPAPAKGKRKKGGA